MSKLALIARHYDNLKSAREAVKKDEVILKVERGCLVIKESIWAQIENKINATHEKMVS